MAGARAEGAGTTVLTRGPGRAARVRRRGESGPRGAGERRVERWAEEAGESEGALGGLGCVQGRGKPRAELG